MGHALERVVVGCELAGVEETLEKPEVERAVVSWAIAVVPGVKIYVLETLQLAVGVLQMQTMMVLGRHLRPHALQLYFLDAFELAQHEQQQFWDYPRDLCHEQRHRLDFYRVYRGQDVGV